tara:strand:+ start:54 stop:599 length:546 start_codon:yes stop_codon:yes gene_type:complete
MALTKIAAGGMPSGSILQVKQSQFLGNEETTASSFQDITDLTVSITPLSTASKMFISVMISCHSTSNQRFGIKVVKSVGGGSFSDFLLPDFSAGDLGGATTSNSARLLAHAIGTGRGSNVPNDTQSIRLLDSPSTTSVLVYKVQAMAEGSQTLFVNKPETFSNADTVFAPMSTITVMEVAG